MLFISKEIFVEVCHLVNVVDPWRSLTFLCPSANQFVNYYVVDHSFELTIQCEPIIWTVQPLGPRSCIIMPKIIKIWFDRRTHNFQEDNKNTYDDNE